MLRIIEQRITRTNMFGIMLCVTIIAALTNLAFSVRTYHDKVIFGLMVVVLIYNVVCDIKQNKKVFIRKLRSLFFGSAKWLFIAIALYYIYDIITMFYTKDIYHALKKLPYMLEYTVIFLAALYYIKSSREFKQVLFSIGISGTIVSVCTYFYYAFSLRPIYFQRLSTARDYNVFACLIFITFIILAYLIICVFKISFIKKLILFLAITIVNLPVFYFAGSRRMFIMLPYFFGFLVLFATIVLASDCIKAIRNRSKGKISFNYLTPVAFFAVIVVLYLGCIQLIPVFTAIGSAKETTYNNFIKDKNNTANKPSDKDNGEPSPSEKTINNVLETIDDKSMLNKRSIIYNTAFEELKNYSVIDWTFGRGSAYDIHMFDVTDNKALLAAYQIDENSQRSKGWMSAHNFMIADLLNGGIIKLLLGIFIVIQIISHIIKAIKFNNKNVFLLVVPIALVIVNNFISGAYGMFNDLFFYVMMIVLCSALKLSESDAYRKEDLDVK